MDEGLSGIYNVVWNKIFKALGHDDFKIALMMPPGYRGDERVEEIRSMNIDIEKKRVVLAMLDGHNITFYYDPEARIFELLYGARWRKSPDYEAKFSAWSNEYDTLNNDRKQGKISQSKYNRLYAEWRKREPKERVPEYLELFNSRKSGQMSPDDFLKAYKELDEKKWSKRNKSSSRKKI